MIQRASAFGLLTGNHPGLCIIIIAQMDGTAVVDVRIV